MAHRNGGPASSSTNGRRAKRGSSGSDDSGPEVEFGAFLRGASRPGVSNASSSSYLPPNSESRQGGQNGRPAPGSRRNGTPRLGGLGLGGVGLSSPPGSPARSKAPPPSRPNYPFPPPPQPSTSSANGNRTSSTRDSSSELVRPEHFDPSSTSPPTFPSRVPPNPFPDVNSINQRPFLSPEMAKPTLRAGAFALDRPVPDGRSTTTTTTVEPPSSPTSPNSSTFDSSAENSKAIPVRQRVDSTSSLQATVANGELFGGLQATLEGEEGGQEEEEKEELLVEGGKDRHRDEDEDEDDDLETTCAPQSVEVDDDLASAPSPTLSPPSPEAPLPPSLTSFAPPPLPSTPPRPVSSALPSTPEAAPLLVETASQTPIHIRGTSLIDTLPQEDVPVLQAADRTSTGSSATGTTNSSGPATPPVLLDSAPIVQLAEVPHLIARTDPAFSTFPLVAKIRTVDRRRGSVDSSVEADDSEGASFYNEPTRPLDLANRLPSRTRGPPPPRPKRLRAPVVGGQAMAVQAIAGAGGGGAEYQRELLVTSEETVDSGEGEVANEGRSNGGGSMRGASSSSGRRLEATRGSFYTSSSATSVALSPPSYPPSGPPATPPFAAPLPPRTTSPIVTRLAPPIESTAELLDHFSSATPTLDPSPTMSSTSTMSSSSGFSEASRESFFFHPPPPRTSIDQGLPAAVVPPATVASPLPPPPAAPVPAPTEPTPLVEKRGSYHGLGLRLPSSITPSSPYVTPTPLPSSPPPPPSMALPQPTREAQNIPDPLPTLAPLPISDPLSFASRPSTATPVAAPRPDEKAAATVDTAAPKRVLAVLPPALADTIVDSSPSATATSSNPVDEGETLATVAIGAVVSGSIAVGYTAWRGLSAAASAGSSWGWNRFSVAAPRSASEQDEVVGPSEVVFPGMFRPITPIGDDGDSLSGSDTEEGDTFYHDAEDSDDEAEEERDEDGTESSVISTEWGDIHFPAPEGFLEAFKEAMAELGPEDLAANERTELDAQEAAYLSASRAHQEVVSSPTPSPSRPLPASDLSGLRGFESRKDNRLSTMSMDSSRTLQTHDAFDDDGGTGTLTPRFSTFTTPSGASSSSITSSSKSVAKLRRPISLAPSATSTPPKKKKSGFFSFGSKKRSERESSVESSSSQSIASTVPSSFARLAAVVSADSSTSSSRSKERPKSMIFGDRFTPAPPSVESEIGDATYVSYASGRTAARRGSSTSSGSSATPDVSLPAGSSNPPTRSASAPTRRSSLRQQSRFDPNRRRTVSTSLNDESAKTLYTVRFGNATRGLGLKSVAEDEAVKGGGDTHAMKWIGVGRGRYGNLTLQTDEASDELYADQAAQIKKKWRAFGTSQERDWANVKID